MKVYRKQIGRRGIWIKILLDYRFSRSDLLKACLILMPLGITYQPVKFYYTGPIWHQFAALERSRSFFTRQQADSFYNSPPFSRSFSSFSAQSQINHCGANFAQEESNSKYSTFLTFSFYYICYKSFKLLLVALFLCCQQNSILNPRCSIGQWVPEGKEKVQGSYPGMHSTCELIERQGQ